MDVGHQLKTLRENRKLSMRELAAMSGISMSLVSKIESSKVSPTVMTLHKLVEAMNVDLFEFFFDRSAGSPSEQIVFQQSDMVVSQDPEHIWRYAFPRYPDIRAQLVEAEYMPHSRVIEKEKHKGDVFGFVVSGELTIETKETGAVKVKAGDAYYIKANLPHVSKNDGDEPLKLVAVNLLV